MSVPWNYLTAVISTEGQGLAAPETTSSTCLTKGIITFPISAFYLGQTMGFKGLSSLLTGGTVSASQSWL